MKNNWPEHNLFFKYNELSLIHSGKEFESIFLLMINSAKSFIHLQFYIFLEDESSQVFIEGLKKAANRGVKIYILLDALGSRKLSKNFFNSINHPNIYFLYFNPLFKKKRIGWALGRRLHRKVITVDGGKALVGGINIGIKFNDEENPWLDYALLIKGDAACKINSFCSKTWLQWSGSLPHTFKFSNKDHINIQTTKPIYLLPRVNDWAGGDDQVYMSYLNAFDNSQERIFLISSYFLPGHKLIRKLVKASKRGVDVRIIMGGVSDLRLMRSAGRYLYGHLLKHGIRVFEWQKSILHAKGCVVDDYWTTIGSYNLNYSSRIGNLEMNIDVLDKNFSALFADELESVMALGCREIIPLDWPKRSLGKKIKDFISYWIMRLLFSLPIYQNIKRNSIKEQFPRVLPEDNE